MLLLSMDVLLRLLLLLLLLIKTSEGFCPCLGELIGFHHAPADVEVLTGH